MLSNYIETFALSLIQGIFEFLPISSSAHLLITSEIFNFKSSSLIIDISLHLGSLLAIVFYFRKDLVNFFKKKNLALLIIVGSIPLIVFGFLLYKTNLIYYLRNIETIAWATLIFGIILYFSDKIKVKKKFDDDLNFKSILIIGILQIFALIPGASRSGVVITAGRFLNFDRYDSSKISFYLSIPALAGASRSGVAITAGRLLNFDRYDSSKISFYLSIPALAGASSLGIKDAFDKGIEFNILVIFSVIFSFLFSYLTIKYFLAYVKKFNLNIFVYYRILLAGVLLIVVYA